VTLPALVRVALLASIAVSTTAAAQAYPAKPVRVITGGAATFHDIVTRLLADRLGKRCGQAVAVEAQPGAGMTIGTGMAARAAPDGYTLVVSDRSALAVAPNLYKSLPYDAQKDLAPVTLIALAPPVLVVHPSFPAANLRELVAYVKAHPGEVNYASAGPGTATHVAGEVFRSLASLDLPFVHYKGGGPAALALVAGEVPVGAILIPAALPHIRSGRLRALAIAGNARFAGLPEVPTGAEAGLPGFESQFWIGLLAPARTPAPIVAQLNREVGEILRAPDMQAALLNQGAVAAPGTPEDFARFIRSETAAMKALIERTGMRID